MPKKNSSRVIVNLNNQTIRIPLDVKHYETFDRIRAGKYAPHFRQVFPVRLLGDAVPDVEAFAETGMLLCRFEQLLAADNMHWLYYIRKMRIRQ